MCENSKSLRHIRRCQQRNVVAGRDTFDPDLWLEHLGNDILPFLLLPSAWGNPIGNYPTFRFQDGTPSPLLTKRYVRMLGRQVYAYFIAFMLLGKEELFALGMHGLDWIRKHATNPRGGFFAQLREDGTPLQETPISIQDLSYALLAFVTHYRLTGDDNSKAIIDSVSHLILSGPFRDEKCFLMDQLDSDLREKVNFEGEELNLVSLLDFLHVVLLPMSVLAPDSYRSSAVQMFVNWLIANFFDRGIFWNNAKNRSDYSAKHVDLGHTSKGFLVCLEAERNGMSIASQVLALNRILSIYRNAESSQFGWLTDFKNSANTFRKLNWQWWRQLVINQFLARYAKLHPEVIPLLRKGCQNWLESKFIDRERSCRGIREGLKTNGNPYCRNRTMICCKANEWKNSFHEVEHVLYLYLFSCQQCGRAAQLYYKPVGPAFKPLGSFPFAGRTVSSVSLPNGCLKVWEELF